MLDITSTPLTSSLFRLLQSSSIALLTSIVVFYVYSFLFPLVPAYVPRVGEAKGKRHFSLRTRWAYFTDCEKLFQEAYQKVPRNLYQFPAFGTLNHIRSSLGARFTQSLLRVYLFNWEATDISPSIRNMAIRALCPGQCLGKQ